MFQILSNLNDLAGRELGLRQRNHQKLTSSTPTSSAGIAEEGFTSPRSETGLGFCAADPFLTEVVLCILASLLGFTFTISSMTLLLLLVGACRRTCGAKRIIHDVRTQPGCTPAPLIISAPIPVTSGIFERQAEGGQQMEMESLPLPPASVLQNTCEV